MIRIGSCGAVLAAGISAGVSSSSKEQAPASPTQSIPAKRPSGPSEKDRFINEGIGGGISRYAAAWITGPLDTIRSTAQNGNSQSVVANLRLIAAEGPRKMARTLYSPVPALALKDGLKGISRFWSKSFVEDLACSAMGLNKSNLTPNQRSRINYLSGFIGAFCVESPVTAVPETLQIYKSTAGIELARAATQRASSHTLDTLKAIVVRSNVWLVNDMRRFIPTKTVITAGILPVAVRNGAFAGAMFWGQGKAEELMGPCPEPLLQKLSYHFVAGTISAVPSVLFSVPFQVIQVQSANLVLDQYLTRKTGGSEAAKLRVRSGELARLRTVCEVLAKKEPSAWIKELFKGAVPKILRQSPNITLVFFLHHEFKSFMK